MGGFQRSAVAVVCAAAGSSEGLSGQSAPPADTTITIVVGQIIDGRGGVITNGTVVIRGGRIVRVDREPVARPTFAFPNGALLPGLIDLHVHPASYARENRLHAPGDGDPLPVATFAAIGNVERTLRAGFTTVQSLGSPSDVDLRAAIADGMVTGPRLLTSLNPIADASLSPDSLRALVRQRAAAGADAIKLFASRSLGDGGAPTMSQEQLEAICGEAKARRLRSVVHAHGSESIRRAVSAGCNEIEHGVFATQDVLTLMAERGTYFDPQCNAVFQNYLDHRLAWFAGQSYATPEGEALLKKGLELGVAVTRAASTTPGLKLVFGTDAVAVGNGRNVDDLICRVQQAGQKPMDVIRSATSLNAEALGLGTEAGAVASGLGADLLVVAGNPLNDITALRKVVLVLRAGRVAYYDPQ
jgi:imidazolonepropionase-like amidohydrolase